MSRQAGITPADVLRAAEFTPVRVESKPMKSVPVVCALGIKWIAGLGTGGGRGGNCRGKDREHQTKHLVK